MLHGSLHDVGTTTPLGSHPIWQQAFAWLQSLPANPELGEFPLQGQDLYASVQTYSTLARHEARFENHEAYVDLQYTIDGGEIIDWIPRSELQAAGPFERDVQFWLPPTERWTPLTQLAGRFAVFYPSDAHRPKVRLEGYDRVKKVVVKIHRKLLS